MTCANARCRATLCADDAARWAEWYLFGRHFCPCCRAAVVFGFREGVTLALGFVVVGLLLAVLWL